MDVFYFLSALKLKTPTDTVIYIISAQPNEREIGRLKRCMYIQRAFQESSIKGNTCAKLV